MAGPCVVRWQEKESFLLQPSSHYNLKLKDVEVFQFLLSLNLQLTPGNVIDSASMMLAALGIEPVAVDKVAVRIEAAEERIGNGHPVRRLLVVAVGRSHDKLASQDQNHRQGSRG